MRRPLPLLLSRIALALLVAWAIPVATAQAATHGGHGDPKTPSPGKRAADSLGVAKSPPAITKAAPGAHRVAGSEQNTQSVNASMSAPGPRVVFTGKAVGTAQAGTNDGHGGPKVPSSGKRAADSKNRVVGLPLAVSNSPPSISKVEPAANRLAGSEQNIQSPSASASPHGPRIVMRSKTPASSADTGNATTASTIGQSKGRAGSFSSTAKTRTAGAPSAHVSGAPSGSQSSRKDAGQTESCVRSCRAAFVHERKSKKQNGNELEAAAAKKAAASKSATQESARASRIKDRRLAATDARAAKSVSTGPGDGRQIRQKGAPSRQGASKEPSTSASRPGAPVAFASRQGPPSPQSPRQSQPQQPPFQGQQSQTGQSPSHGTTPQQSAAYRPAIQAIAGQPATSMSAFAAMGWPGYLGSQGAFQSLAWPGDNAGFSPSYQRYSVVWPASQSCPQPPPALQLAADASSALPGGFSPPPIQFSKSLFESGPSQGLSLFFVLATAAGFAAQAMRRKLPLASAAWQAAAFLLVPERPG